MQVRARFDSSVPTALLDEVALRWGRWVRFAGGTPAVRLDSSRYVAAGHAVGRGRGGMWRQGMRWVVAGCVCGGRACGGWKQGVCVAAGHAVGGGRKGYVAAGLALGGSRGGMWRQGMRWV